MPSFMITDGSQYLKRDATGNYVPVKNKALGDVWAQRNKAQNILQNCVNKNFRVRYRLVEIDDKKLISNEQLQESKVLPNDSAARSISEEDIPENDLASLSSNIDHMITFILDTEKRKEELNTALSDVDKEISDIHHYIEFGTHFNAYQGWLAFNMLRNRLKKRRKIKDELKVLIQLGDCKVNSKMMQDIRKSIDEMKTREYHPRILKDLFDKGE